MATATENMRSANDTLARRRQKNSELGLKRQREVYSRLPEIENIGFEITSLGAKYTMANLAKQYDKAAELKSEMTALLDKKRRILTENGFAENYLDPVYSCAKCKDTGFADGKICTCLKQEIIKERQNMLTALSPAPQKSFEDFSLKYYSGLVTEDGYDCYEQMSAILEYCKSYAENFSSGDKSIYMYGTAGLGKTHLSCAIAKVCIENGFVVMYASSQSLFEQIEQHKYNVEDILNDILSCDLFILDDLGTEYLTHYGLSVFYNIINTRMLNGTPCIFSSNITNQKDLERKYGEKIASRLLGNCVALNFIGKDIRPQI